WSSSTINRSPFGSVVSFGTGSLTLRTSSDTGALPLSTICVVGGGCGPADCAARGAVQSSESVAWAIRLRVVDILMSSAAGTLRRRHDDAAIGLHEILFRDALHVV